MTEKRLEYYWSSEMKSMLNSYRQFETLIPSSTGAGAAHRGEDGRYVEGILKNMLQKFLPGGVEILTGFILRAGVESGFSGKARKKDKDRHSSQLDLIIYDSINYPVYQRFGDTAVVLPEGVLGIISVKKTLAAGDLEHEMHMLRNAAQLCAFEGRQGPFLALVGMDDSISTDAQKCGDKVFAAIQKTAGAPVCYGFLPSFVGSLKHWTIHKIHRAGNKSAEYELLIHQDGEEHLGLQFLIRGILRRYYSPERNHGKMPGFNRFSWEAAANRKTVSIPYQVEDGCLPRQ